MKKMRNIIPVMLAAGAISLGGQAFAEDNDQDESRAQRASSETNAAAQATSEKQQSELKVSDQEAQQQVQDANKTSKLIGMKVKNKDNEELGQIKDLVVDFKSGKVAYAVLVHGATLGFGGKMIAVPFNSLTVQTGEKALLLNLPKNQLAQAPGFDEDNWPDLNAGASNKTIGLAASSSIPSSEENTAQGASEIESGEISGSERSDASTTNSLNTTSSERDLPSDPKGTERSSEEQQP